MLHFRRFSLANYFLMSDIKFRNIFLLNLVGRHEFGKQRFSSNSVFYYKNTNMMPSEIACYFRAMFTRYPVNFSSFSTTAIYKPDFIASVICKKYPEVGKSSNKRDLIKIIDTLISFHVSADEIIQNVDVLKKSSNYSQIKIVLLKEIESDISLVLPLLSLPVSVLNKAAKRAKEDENLIKHFPNRLAYLSHHLKIAPTELVSVLRRHSMMLTMKFDRLSCKMNILISAGINPEDIVKDLWIFNYTEKLLNDRVNIAKEADFALKPWHLRCSKKMFYSTLLKNKETQHILHGSSHVSYLCKKLDCSEVYLKYMFENSKALPTINIVKLEKILDFLYEKGYTPEEVRIFPKILCSKLETLKERFERFYNKKHSLPTIPQLSASAKRFSKTLE